MSQDPSVNPRPNRAARRAAAKAAPRRTPSRTVGLVGGAAVLAAGGGAAALALLASPASGTTTLTVDSIADGAADATHCTNATTGDCTLRDALAAMGNGDTINFSIPAASTVTLDATQGAMVMTHSGTINGPGSSNLVLDAANNSRVFEVASSITGDVSISGLALLHGSADIGAGLMHSNHGRLSLHDTTIALNSGRLNVGINSGGHSTGIEITDSVISNNSSTQGSSGGYLFAQGPITLDHLVVADNTTAGSTAGLRVATTPSGGVPNPITVVDTEVRGNVTTNTAFPNSAPGGLVLIGGTEGVVSVASSTFAANVGGSGAGISIVVYGADSRVDVANTTITGNHGDVGSAGLSIYGTGADINLFDDTITGNVKNDLTRSDASGVGIFLYDAGPTFTTNLTVTGSIISGNTGGASAHDIDVYRSGGGTPTPVVAVSDHSILGTVAGVTITDAGGTLTGVADLGLNALAANGGPTRTMSLKPTSPALNTGPLTQPTFVGNAFDQRGAGFARTARGRSDIGAFEVQAPRTIVVDTVADGPANPSDCLVPLASSCSLRDALAAAIDGDTITFSVANGSTLTMAPINGQFVIGHAITIAGPGRNALTIDGLNQTRVFYAPLSVTGDVTLSGLTITRGNSGGADGGGLNTRNRGTTTLRDVGLVSNASAGGAGGLSTSLAQNVVLDRVVLEGNAGAIGGAYVGADSAITITGLAAHGNTGTNNAGGLSASSQSFTMTASSFDSNTGSTGGVRLSTGGVASTATTITNSTFSNNIGIDEGGLNVFTSNSALTIANSTITGNRSGISGAGMRLYLDNSSATLAQLTVTGNTLTGTTTGNYYGGGGLFLYGGQGTNTATIIGSIVAGNTNSVFHDIDFHKYNGQSSMNVTIDHSLIGTTGTAGPATVTPADGGGNTLGVTDPQLGALADNGGPTLTMLPVVGSPAIDAGPTSVAEFPGNTVDQRGSGFARVRNGRVDIGAVEVQSGSSAVTFTPLDPARIVDTRANGTTVDGVLQRGGAVGAGGTLQVQVTGRGNVPATGVSAVQLNVTAVGPTGANSFLTVYPSDESRPTASNLNFTAGRTVANAVTAKLAADGSVTVYNQSGTVNVIVDVVGWYADGGSYVPLTPARLMDTRSNGTTIDGAAQRTGALTAASTRDVVIGGRGGVPATGVEAVVLNVTAVGPTAGSYLTVFPTGLTRPNASNLNVTAGRNVPNSVVVKLGTGGAISVYNNAGTVNVLVDVAGYFTAGGAFHALDPGRVVDTRSSGVTVDGQYQGIAGGGALGDDEQRQVCLANRAGIGAAGSVGAVVLNVTATRPTSGGFLTLFPDGLSSVPNASNVNFGAGVTVPNLAVAKVSTSGCIRIFNRQGPATISPSDHTDVIVDVAGWFDAS